MDPEDADLTVFDDHLVRFRQGAGFGALPLLRCVEPILSLWVQGKSSDAIPSSQPGLQQADIHA